MAEPALDEAVAREQLAQLLPQFRRVPVALLAVDGLLVWLCARNDQLVLGSGWFVAGAALQALRAWRGRALQRTPPASARAALDALLPVYAANGVVRAAVVPLLFAPPPGEAEFIATMLMIGLAAGGVGSVAGRVAPYLLWAVPICVALVGGWLWQGGLEGLWISVLLVLMFGLLTLFVRDQGRGLARLVQLAHENERLAASLRAERDRAQAASESKTRFFAAASHDLRQPLHALSIHATTLELVARRQTDPLVRELSQNINRALGQSNSLLESLLDVSRLDAGAMKLEIESIDVAALLGSVHEAFLGAATQAGLTLALELPAHEALWIGSDAELMRRILNNLVSNALKFTPAGGVRLSAAAGVDGRVRIAVHDTGVGIPAAEHERVFEEFFQLGNPSRDRSRGLGLGLSIVRRATALLGIGIALDSAPGRGTRVELAVPASAPPPRPPPAVEEPAPAWPAAVLVVDDEPEILQALAGLLRVQGIEARCAVGSDEALATLADGFAPQALLVDHRLRGESGGEAIARLRARLGPLPAVVITGDTSPDNLVQLRAGGFDVLHKPVDGLQLMRSLERAMRAVPAGAAG